VLDYPKYGSPDESTPGVPHYAGVIERPTYQMTFMYLLVFSKVMQRRFDVFLYKTGLPLGALVALLIGGLIYIWPRPCDILAYFRSNFSSQLRVGARLDETGYISIEIIMSKHSESVDGSNGSMDTDVVNDSNFHRKHGCSSRVCCPSDSETVH
jgi:hypothetical protein